MAPASEWMDCLEIEGRGRAAGLPAPVARWVAEAVAASALGADHRDEVFEELVSHFHDGIAAGREAEELLASFGSGRETAALIGQTKRVLTDESQGGRRPRSILTCVKRDVRDVARRLLAAPAFTATAVLSLALGIGANTAIFSVVNEVILRRPPIQQPDRLVDAYRASAGAAPDGLSEPDIADFRRLTSVFTGVASTRMTWIWYNAGEDIRFTGEAVSADYFQVLGLRPLLGRFIAPSDAPGPGEGRVVVLGERTWRTVFGADPDVVGQSLRLNGTNFRVLGVARADYPGRLRAFPTDVYVPVMMIDRLERTSPSQLQDRANGGTFATFQLRPGVSVAQARGEVDRLVTGLRARGIQQWERQVTVDLIPNARMIIDPTVDQVIRPVAAMLMLIVGLVLVVACANLAGLLLARTMKERREGVARLSFVRPFLLETVLIGLVAGVIGTLLGRAALRALLGSEIPFPIPMDLRLPFDWRVITYALVISLGAGVASGLLPGGRAEGTRHRSGLRNVLVGGQVAVAMVLLVVAALFARSFDAARRVDPGFGHAPGALVWFGGRPDSTGAALDRLVQEAARVPGVEAVGLTSLPHLNPIGARSIEVAVTGMTAPVGRRGFDVDAAGIDTGYVATIGLRVLSGRNLTRMDQVPSWRAVLVNDEFVRQYYPGSAGVGERFDVEGREVEIVGVVNTARIRSLGEAPRPFIYYPGDATMDWLVVRTTGDPGPLLPALRRAVGAADPGFFVAQVNTMARFMESQAYPFKLGAVVLMALAIFAMAMASIGVYGAASWEMAQQRLPTDGLRVVGAGAVAGLVLALLAGRLLEQLLFGVRALDPVSLIGMSLVLLGAASIAAYLPTRRERSIHVAPR